MNTDKLREKYVTDADAMASKSRFGYFSMLPSHTAAHTDFPPARRKVHPIQPTETTTEELYASLATSMEALARRVRYVKTIFPICPHLSTVRPSRIRESTNGWRNWR